MPHLKLGPFFIYFSLLFFFFFFSSLIWDVANLSGSVGCTSDWWTEGCRLDLCQVSNILLWKLIMKYFLLSFSPLWFKKGSCPPHTPPPPPPSKLGWLGVKLQHKFWEMAQHDWNNVERAIKPQLEQTVTPEVVERSSWYSVLGLM